MLSYDYDAKRRMIIKKVPGAVMVYMVYNARDLMVMSQDGNLRNGGLWLLYKFDKRNNPIETDIAIMPTTTTRYQLQLAAENVVDFVPPQMIAFEPQVQTFYDNYTWLQNWVNPAVVNGSYDNSYNTYLNQSTGVWPYPELVTEGSGELRGKVTGTRTRVLGSSTYLYTINIYNEKGQLVQVKSTSITGGVDIVTTQYSWAGQQLMTVQHMKNSSGSTEQMVVTRNTYTAQGQLEKIEKRVQHPSVSGGQWEVG